MVRGEVAGEQMMAEKEEQWQRPRETLAWPVALGETMPQRSFGLGLKGLWEVQGQGELLQDPSAAWGRPRRKLGRAEGVRELLCGL